MRYLDRPKTAGPSLARAPALYQSVPAGNLPTPFLFVKVFLQDGQIGHISTIAGVGTSGPNRDLFQERTALSGIAGTTYEPYQRTRHHRTQHLQVGEGGVLRLDPGKPGVGGRPLFYKPTDSWQPFVGGKNGHENFRQTRIYNFRDKCVFFAQNRKFAYFTQ